MAGCMDLSPHQRHATAALFTLALHSSQQRTVTSGPWGFGGQRELLAELLASLHSSGSRGVVDGGDGCVGKGAELLSSRAIDLIAVGGLLPMIYSHLKVPTRSWPALLNLPSQYLAESDARTYTAPTGDAAANMSADELKDAQQEEARQHERVRLRQQQRRMEMVDMYMGVLDPQYIPPVRQPVSRLAVEMQELESGAAPSSARVSASGPSPQLDRSPSPEQPAGPAGDAHVTGGATANTTGSTAGGTAGCTNFPGTPVRRASRDGAPGAAATERRRSFEAAARGCEPACGNDGALACDDGPESGRSERSPLLAAVQTPESLREEAHVPGTGDTPRARVEHVRDHSWHPLVPGSGSPPSSPSGAGWQLRGEPADGGAAAEHGNGDKTADGDTAKAGAGEAGAAAAGAGDAGALRCADPVTVMGPSSSVAADPATFAGPSSNGAADPVPVAAEIDRKGNAALAPRKDSSADALMPLSQQPLPQQPLPQLLPLPEVAKVRVSPESLLSASAVIEACMSMWASKKASADDVPDEASVAAAVAAADAAIGADALDTEYSGTDAAAAGSRRGGGGAVADSQRAASKQDGSRRGGGDGVADSRGTASKRDGSGKGARVPCASVEPYDARARTALYAMARWMGISDGQVRSLERLHMAQQLLVWMRPDVAAIAGEGSAGSLRGDMTNAAANARAAADAQGSSKLIKGLKVGGVAVAAGALLAVTGGLAAPAIAAGLGSLSGVLGGGAAAATVTAAAGAAGTAAGAVTISGAMGAYGASYAAARTHRMVSGVSEFGYVDLGSEDWARSRVREAHKAAEHDAAACDHAVSSEELVSQWWSGEKGPPRLEVPWNLTRAEDGAASVTIAVNGWLRTGPVDFFEPWVNAPSGFGNRFALVWETELLTGLGGALMRMVTNKVLQEAGNQFLKAMALGTLVAAFALPMAAMSALNMLLGDRWVAALRRSKLVGVLLAHQLVSGCAGGCPVILVAFSMGARAVFHCLLELHRLGKRGIVQHVVLMGTPVQVNEEKWAAARSVVSGRFVNAYSDKARQCQP